jgi:hypothetical protein
MSMGKPSRVGERPVKASLPSGDRPSHFLTSSFFSTRHRPCPSAFQTAASACGFSARRTPAGSSAPLSRPARASSAALSPSPDPTTG